MVSSITANVVHDVAVCHPFGDHREPPILKEIRNTDKCENVGMGQVLPHDNFFTELLYNM